MTLMMYTTMRRGSGMNARVNPFTKEVILRDDSEQERVIEFTELDDWATVDFDGNLYDVHFHYEDVFELSVYPYDENGWTDYTDSILKKVTIEY
jgi:hypothetical protein